MDNSYNTQVLVGAGSGMASLRAILDEKIERSRKTNQACREIYFFYGARTEIDLLYADDFYAMADQNINIHYTQVLSKRDDDWLGAAYIGVKFRYYGGY